MDDLFVPSHLIIILIIALLIFGPGKLPELGAGLGRAVSNFKKSMAGVTDAAQDLKKSVAVPSARQAMRDLAMTVVAEPEAQEQSTDHTSGRNLGQ